MSSTGSEGSVDLNAEARAFGQVREVLAGRLRVPLDAGSSKVLFILFRSATDAVVTPDVFGVHFGPQKRRRPFSYFRSLAPAVVSELLDRAALESVAEPLIIGLPAGDVARVPGYPAWSFDAKLVWIVPAAEVKIVVRHSPERWSAPFVRPIPTDGPLALRELPDWALQVEHRNFERPLECPRCGTQSSCYRQAGNALVCQRCGRSFELGD
jgi:hypothetical protein